MYRLGGWEPPGPSYQDAEQIAADERKARIAAEWIEPVVVGCVQCHQPVAEGKTTCEVHYAERNRSHSAGWRRRVDERSEYSWTFAAGRTLFRAG